MTQHAELTATAASIKPASSAAARWILTLPIPTVKGLGGLIARKVGLWPRKTGSRRRVCFPRLDRRRCNDREFCAGKEL
jgi:hypothetical protein